MSDRERAVRLRLRDDFPHYAGKCLRIRTKAGTIDPLSLNSAQMHIHKRVEAQRARTGMVRAIILKGRQQGCSTYVEGRFYHQTTHRHGVRAFILTHELEATNTLFGMAERYHENCPALVKPETGSSNAKELIFSRLDSGYRVGTAGTKGTGRSQTIQLFHGSEVAWWPHADTHASGVLQAVPNEPGTEVFLESTANGQGNYFHKQWRQAVAGDGAFEAIFIPWFWQTEYRLAAPDFRMTSDEAEIATLHKLAPEQMAWRRMKIGELGGESFFHQEYPMTPEEAFQADATEVVIPISLARSAIGRQVETISRGVVWGVDVARFGDDDTALAKRKGNRLLERVQTWSKLDTMQVAGTIFREYENTPHEDLPVQIAVDVIGIGAGVVDRLRELQLPVVGVNVAESPAVGAKYLRLRDELWFMAKEWFEGRDVILPEDDALISELTAVKYRYSSSNKLRVESKDEMKDRGLASPDRADAFCLTFALGETRPKTDVAWKRAMRKGMRQASGRSYMSG
jgi:hypothetical protein